MSKVAPEDVIEMRLSRRASQNEGIAHNCQLALYLESGVRIAFNEGGTLDLM